MCSNWVWGVHDYRHPTWRPARLAGQLHVHALNLLGSASRPTGADRPLERAPSTGAKRRERTVSMASLALLGAMLAARAFLPVPAVASRRRHGAGGSAAVPRQPTPL